MLLIHGARAALLAAHRVQEPDTLQPWVLGVEARTAYNKAIVALANRSARRVWRDERPSACRFNVDPSGQEDRHTR
jgi:hypothetical protein